MEINRDISRETSSDCSDCWENAKDLAIKTYRLVSNGDLNSDQELKQALITTTVFLMSYLSMAKEQDVDVQDVPNHRESLGQGHLEDALECVAVFRTYLVIIRELGYIGEGQFLDFEDYSVRISAQIHDCIKVKRKERVRVKRKRQRKRARKQAGKQGKGRKRGRTIISRFFTLI
jgi:hypothetical protein